MTHSLAFSKTSSPIGTLHLVASEDGLRGIHFSKPKTVAANLSTPKALSILRQAEKELEEYFNGTRTEFEVPLEFEGTPFQKRVWNELRRIPYGETVSYSDIAKRIRNAKAVRAVGSANGKNPLCVIIPCHRVVAADGSIGGYTGGLKIKTRLLALEQISTS